MGTQAQSTRSESELAIHDGRGPDQAEKVISIFLEAMKH
jgi:hypothetical protein